MAGRGREAGLCEQGRERAAKHLSVELLTVRLLHRQVQISSCAWHTLPLDLKICLIVCDMQE